MARQARAVRTRRMILEAAAAVFDELGYEGASTTEILARSGLTRGALYFHFPSKEAIADAVVDLQNEALVPPENKVRLQSLIDVSLAFAERLRSDVVVRAAVRLSVEQVSYKASSAAYRGPADIIENLLLRARDEGELLSTVDPQEVTQLIQGAFIGTQLLSQVYDPDRLDLPERIATLWKYLLPSLAIPGLLPHLSADPGRGRLVLERQAARAADDDPDEADDSDEGDAPRVAAAREHSAYGGGLAGPATGDEVQGVEGAATNREVRRRTGHRTARAGALAAPAAGMR
ncbi:ScbR family autoregulator-binding transcription factor [Streptomyces sp. ICBB 8177]|uniref:ScbR family autoregulator-binding transcription factor n=1 Tax=Streptomyces sp. ICBB 8177 TaxID=563922 RepID=UPI0018EEB808|nr:ScbR family autoregulator-binding transcription factor [Streptomyces sp. ICBB 8177]